MHALIMGQSVFKIHSGRQPEYGSPWYSLKHEQIPLLHNAFDPHGDGLHGSSYCGLGAMNQNYWNGLLMVSSYF